MEQEEKPVYREDKIFGLVNLIVNSGYLPAEVEFRHNRGFYEPLDILEISFDGARFINLGNISILEPKGYSIFKRFFYDKFCIFLGDLRFCTADNGLGHIGLDVWGRDNLQKMNNLLENIRKIGWNVRGINLKSEYTYELKGGI